VSGRSCAIEIGVWHLSQRMPEVPIIPVGLRGTERVMASNRIPLPLFIDVNIGDALSTHPEKKTFMDDLEQRLTALCKPRKEIIPMTNSRIPDERHFVTSDNTELFIATGLHKPV
jgi:1-acyl-sn-glycerol-3-phosphate acyltransferase